MKIERKIVFWAWKNRPSLAMRGKQIADALAEHGLDTEVRAGPSRMALRDVYDSIVVCVKSYPSFPNWLLRGKNILVYDAIDFSSIKGIPSNASAIIGGSKHLCARIQKKVDSSILVKTIYHHSDPYLKPHVAGEDSLRLVYIGEPESSKFIKGEIPELNLVSFKKNPGWREELRNYNAHFSARFDRNKSVIKLSNAAALGAVFLTGKEPGIVEILGEDYPFFLKAPKNLPSVLEDVNNLKSSVGTALWKEAREQIDNVRESLTIDAVSVEYMKLFKELTFS